MGRGSKDFQKFKKNPVVYYYHEKPLKEYSVAIFFHGHVAVRIDAANEEDAKELGRKVASFNICHQCSSQIQFDDWDDMEPDCVEI